MRFTKKNIVYIFIAIYAISLLWLSSAWYNSYTRFHWFNDLFEWEYLDKLGHFFASFHLGLFFYKVFGSSGNLNSSLQKKWICFLGFLLLLPIEILDGFSLNYGASPADLLANGLGSIFCYGYVSTQFVSGFLPKFSFHFTAFSLIRPDMLGATVSQQVLKDYNGQTYWLAIDINKILNIKILPSWLSLAVGYGAEGLMGGHDNVWRGSNGQLNDYASFSRTKRIFISVDLNPAGLRMENRLLNYVFAPFVLIKFPAPALEINAERGLIFHLIYF